MKKFKLIKKYPGSPKIGTILSSDTIYTNDKIVLDWKGTSINPNEYPEFWEEIKEPLFITEDGIEIFYKDKLYYLNKINGNRGEYSWRIGKFTDEEYFKENLDKNNFYWFSSKGKLESFWNNLERNKPRFSVRDVEDLTKDLKSQSFKYWDEIIKQKLGI